MRIKHFQRNAPHSGAPSVSMETDTTHVDRVVFHYNGAGFWLCDSAQEARELAAALLVAADAAEEVTEVAEVNA